MKVKELFELLSNGQSLKIIMQAPTGYEDILIYEKGVNKPYKYGELELNEIFVDDIREKTITCISRKLMFI